MNLIERSFSYLGTYVALKNFMKTRTKNLYDVFTKKLRFYVLGCSVEITEIYSLTFVLKHFVNTTILLMNLYYF